MLQETYSRCHTRQRIVQLILLECNGISENLPGVTGPLLYYTLILLCYFYTTSLPEGGGGGALLLGLIGPSWASPTATPWLPTGLKGLTGLKGALSGGFSELLGSTMSFTGGGGEAGLAAAWFEFLNDGSLLREGGSGGGLMGRGDIETKTKSKSNKQMLV